MEHPDQKYIDALINNDWILLDELYMKVSGKIKWLVLQNNGTETDAADIFQEALLAVFNKAKTGNFILTCPIEALIYLICRNKWMNELHKRELHRKVFNHGNEPENAGEDSYKIAEECMVQEARKNLLLEKLAELGDGCKKLLELSWSGKPMEEVAGILNVTYGYARKRKSECMAKLITLVKQSARFNSLKW